MRLTSLSLLAYGPFSGGSLAFAEAPGALEVVYGPNEAGKSTTLRAIVGLFFGIKDTADAHRHEPSRLRVGASLVGMDGRRLDVVRRRGRKGTLLDAADAPLDDDALTPYFRGLTRESYASLFGLDHETLRESAEELLAGKGEVGESLFAAAVGGRGLHELRKRLEEEADRLFLPRARERTINKGMSEVEAARDRLRSAVTTPARYVEQRRAQEDAVRRREALRARRLELEAEQGRLRRVQTTLPYLRRRADLVAGLAAFAGVVELPGDAAARRVAAVHELEDAVREAARAAARRADLEARVAAIVVPDALLAVDDALLAALRDGLSRHLAARKDRPRLDAKAAGIESSVKQRLERLGVERRGTDLQVPLAQAARLRSLAAKRDRLDEALAKADADAADARVRRAHLVARLVVRAPAADRARVEVALEHAARLPVPSLETVERLASERAELETARLAAEALRGKLRERVRQLEREATELSVLGAVPSEAELVAERAARDREFRELRAAAERGDLDAERTARYEARVASADALSDRLRREADRVAERAKLEGDRRALALDVEANDAAIRDAGGRLATFDAGWQALFDDVGVVPLPPREMRPWVQGRDALVLVEEELARGEERGRAARRALEEWQSGWSVAVAAIGLRREASPEEVVAVLDAMAQSLEQVVEAGGYRSRVDGIDRDANRFAELVADATRKILPEAAALPAEEAAERLLARVEQARAARDERAALSQELAQAARAVVQQEERRSEASARIDTLLAAAGAPDLAALAQAEQRSDEVRRLREQIRALDEQLAVAADGASLEAVEAEARGEDLDRARARLREIEGELAALSDDLEAAGQEAWSLERSLHNLTNTDAAECAAVLQDRVAALKRHTRRYLRVRLASEVLGREIERYRRENQGPLLSRAAELFPRLTAGRYTGLRVGVDDGGTPVLVAVRGDEEVEVHGLSDGTRDQLYLSLRLASLERYVGANEPLPLVLDDILVHFDDDRARAALGVLGEVARVTQVLFFTHHARLVELAKEALPQERLVIHRLPLAD